MSALVLETSQSSRILIELDKYRVVFKRDPLMPQGIESVGIMNRRALSRFPILGGGQSPSCDYAEQEAGS